MAKDFEPRGIELSLGEYPRIVFEARDLKSILRRVIPERSNFGGEFYNRLNDPVILHLSKNGLSLTAKDTFSLRRQVLLPRDLNIENVSSLEETQFLISGRKFSAAVNSFSEDPKDNLFLFFSPFGLVVADLEGNLQLLNKVHAEWNGKAAKLFAVLDSPEGGELGSCRASKDDLVAALKTFEAGEPCYFQSDGSGLVISQIDHESLRLGQTMNKGLGAKLRVYPRDVLRVLKTIQSGQEIHDINIDAFDLMVADKSFAQMKAMVLSVSQEFNDIYFVAVIAGSAFRTQKEAERGIVAQS